MLCVCVWQVVSEVKVEGGYRKPEWTDILAVQLFMSPLLLYHWGCKMHHRYYSSTVSQPPLSPLAI